MQRILALMNGQQSPGSLPPPGGWGSQFPYGTEEGNLTYDPYQ